MSRKADDCPSDMIAGSQRRKKKTLREQERHLVRGLLLPQPPPSWANDVPYNLSGELGEDPTAWLLGTISDRLGWTWVGGFCFPSRAIWPAHASEALPAPPRATPASITMAPFREPILDLLVSCGARGDPITHRALLPSEDLLK